MGEGRVGEGGGGDEGRGGTRGEDVRQSVLGYAAAATSAATAAAATEPGEDVLKLRELVRLTERRLRLRLTRLSGGSGGRLGGSRGRGRELGLGGVRHGYVCGGAGSSVVGGEKNHSPGQFLFEASC